jgi:hypothetical protein
VLHTFFCRHPNYRQGCQMVCFQTKNPNLGKVWRVLLWKIYFLTIRSIWRPFEIFYDHLVCFVVIRYIFPVLLFWTKKNLATLITDRRNINIHPILSYVGHLLTPVGAPSPCGGCQAGSYEVAIFTT